LHSGPVMGRGEGLRVVLHGKGGHGSRPETTVDPVLMAAATVLRLQGIVAQEVAARDTAVLTVGALRAGSRPNIVPDQSKLLIGLRFYDKKVHQAMRTKARRWTKRSRS
jgi:metal-dependent amidase/aminoacylase/carboxypeptidase family protein